LNLKLYHNITKIKTKLLPIRSDVMNTNCCISRFSILFFSTLWQMQRSMEWNRAKIEWDAQKLISQNIFRLTSVSQQLRIPFGNVRMFSEKPLSRNRVYNEKYVGPVSSRFLPVSSRASQMCPQNQCCRSVYFEEY